MKTKLFMVGLVMAAAVVCLSCSGNTKEKQLKDIKTDIEQLKKDISEQTVPDDELLINPVLYQISDKHVIFDHHGSETDNMDFDGNPIDHRRLLLPREIGGFEVGYVVKTTRGVTLQSKKSFYFYNELGLTESVIDIYSVAGIIRADGSIIPVKITLSGKENPIMWDCKDSDVLTFEPLVRDDNVKLLCFTVKELKDYCKAHGLKADAVPYLFFTDE